MLYNRCVPMLVYFWMLYYNNMKHFLLWGDMFCPGLFTMTNYIVFYGELVCVFLLWYDSDTQSFTC